MKSRRLMQPSKEAQDHAKIQVETYHIAAWESGVLEAQDVSAAIRYLHCDHDREGPTGEAARLGRLLNKHVLMASGAAKPGMPQRQD